MKKLFVLSFVAALAVAGCSKKKAPEAPKNEATTTEPAADPNAKPADPAAPADPCAAKPADPCAAPKK